MANNFTYHDVDGRTHQRQFDELWPQGYRLISLSVSGTPDNPRYAASWLQRPGVEWFAIHDASRAAFDERRFPLAAQGYVATIVTATGPVGGAVFAGVFEKLPVKGQTEIDLTWGGDTEPGTINEAMLRHRAANMAPLFITAYGTPGDIRFNATWVRTTEPVNWSWWRTSAAAYPRWYKALIRAGLRPALVTPLPGGDYLSIFYDKPWGPFVAEHDLDDARYRDLYQRYVNEHYYLHQVQSAGVGADTRYAAIWVRDDATIPRNWTATGGINPVVNELDAVLAGVMNNRDIRAGSLAVARNGTLLIERGYTWAEPDYPITQPSTLFRQASVSKLFTAAAIDRLVQAGTISWTTAAFPYLNIGSALLKSQSPAPGINQITLDQLATLQSGMAHDFGVTPREMAGLLGLNRPPTNDEMVRFVYGQPLQPVKGTVQDDYSNSAFNVLTAVVERASKQTFVNYLNGVVLQPFPGIGPVFGALTRDGLRWRDEVSGYDDPGAGLSQFDLGPGVIDPNAYGGKWTLESVEGSGGLVTSSATVARVIGRHAVWNRGPRMLSTRHGDFEGTCSGAFSHSSGLDLAYVLNRGLDGTEHDALTNALRDILDRRSSDF